MSELREASVAERASALGAPRRDVDGRGISPMLCAQPEGDDAAAVLDERDRLFELKIDGVRIVADRRDARVSLTYRKSRDATEHYPEVAEALRTLREPRIVLDGEIVAFDHSGRPSFQLLGQRIHLTRPRDIAVAASKVPVTFLVFDVLAVGAFDVRPLPLRDRKALLREIVPSKGTVRLLDHIEGNGRALFEMCRRERLEGIVAKRAASPYRQGPQRTRDWVKIKCERDAELVVVGWTVGERGRQRLGALDLASYEGERLVVRGKVGSGLDERTIDELLPRLEALEIPSSAAEGPFDRAPRGRRFVRPEIVVSVRYLGFSDDGRLRFPVFRGIRDDVLPEECDAGPGGGAIVRDAPLGPSDREPTTLSAVPEGWRRVSITHRSRVMWPDDGITKGELCDYYEAIAPTLLPYLKDRPVVLVRYPYGIGGKHFHQWNIPRWTPSWVRYGTIGAERGFDAALASKRGRASAKSNRRSNETNVFLVDDVDTLLFIVNLGCIPLHVTGSRLPHIDRCDFFTFDLDVGRAGFQAAVVLARSLRAILDAAGLPSFPKTSGQTGLHVVVPLGGEATFATARALADLVASMLVRRHPDLATIERLPEERGDRVYVDVGQTHPLRTIVAPYSVRAVAGATVSTPLGWEEVDDDLDPRRFTLRTIPRRLVELGDPMRGLLDARPDIGAAVQRLGTLLA